ncbi:MULTISPECIES: YbaK/EbsC family protein [Myxococcaceae]|uniref:aminoacyl-tRNA deacylase n=1 Tax=Myxococcaceae TaxID=31 RepID=UPI00188ECF38|nr:YbaK/EbsC family protein [Simulacricoccus sp. 17bor-14]
MRSLHGVIAPRIRAHLERARVPFQTHRHPRAVGAQQVASALHVTGYQVAKGVLVQVDGRPWIAALRAPERVDPERLARLLSARSVRLLEEREFAPLFPDCEPGAEPLLGSLYGLRLALDAELLRGPHLLFHAGSHDEVVELRVEDLVALEHPHVGRFGREPLDAVPRSTPYEESAGATGG